MNACRDCGATIPRSKRGGRPRVRCEACQPPRTTEAGYVIPPSVATNPNDSSVLDALTGGDQVAMLRTLRRLLAEAIDRGVGARDLATLTRRLQEVDAELRREEMLADDDAPNGVIRFRTALANRKASDGTAYRDEPWDPSAI